MRKYIAEFIAVFFLVFVGAGSIVADTYLESFRVVQSFGLLGIAFAHGLALAMAIAAVGHISGGHVNPAISIAMWVSRRLSLKDLGGYIVAQMAGAVAAAGALKLVAPRQLYESFTSIGVPGLAEEVNMFNGIAFEAILTFFLAFVIWGVAVDRRGPASIAPLAIGLTVTFAILAGGAFVGAALNPARWFGPALVAGSWENFLVWIVGPILGALLASLVYETFLLTDDEVEVTVAMEVDDDLEDFEDDLAPRAGTHETRAQEPVPPAPQAAYTSTPTPPEAGFADRPSAPPPPPAAPNVGQPAAPPPPPPEPRVDQPQERRDEFGTDSSEQRRDEFGTDSSEEDGQRRTDGGEPLP